MSEGDATRSSAKRIDAAIWAFVLLGVGLRLLRYGYGRSLWLDEIFLTNNLIHKSALQLLRPLDYRQGAPPLFLLACKYVIHCLGTSEYSLRLVPFLAGVFSVVMFARLARLVLPGRAAIASVALFALLEPLIYYSSEIKQYSMDVAAAVAILWTVGMLASETGGPRRRFWLIGLFVDGLIAIFLSHPAVFVLAGASIWLVRSGRCKLSGIYRVFIGWFLALVADYIFFLRPLEANAGLQHHWSAAYPPISPLFFSWLWTACREIFIGYNTMWLRFRYVGAWPAYAAMILAVIGCRNLYRRGMLGLAGWPIVVTFLAALLRRYPFDDRLILFLVPMVLIMIGAAMEGGAKYAKWALLALVLIPCAGREAVFAMQPPGREEIRPVMAYLKHHWRSGDVLYIYRPADTAFLYYRGQFGLGHLPFVHGQWQSGDAADFINDFHRISGKHRVWVLFSHALPTPGGNEQAEFLELLKRQHAVERDEFAAPGAAIYLFDTEKR